MRKAFVYIDGRNLYHSLETFGIDAYNYNYKELVKKLVTDREVVGIKYYCAKYPAKLDRVKHNRDHAFHQALQKQGISINEGKFKISGEPPRQYAQEKGVDVLLAVDLVLDAFFCGQNGVEDFYIFSHDTDLLPAIRKVREKFKNIKVYACQFRTNADWQRSCDGVHKIFEHVAKTCSNHPVQPTEATLQALLDKHKK